MTESDSSLAGVAESHLDGGGEGGTVNLRERLMHLLADPVTRRRTDRMIGVVVLDMLQLPQPGSDATVARHRRLARTQNLDLTHLADVASQHQGAA